MWGTTSDNNAEFMLDEPISISLLDSGPLTMMIPAIEYWPDIRVGQWEHADWQQSMKITL